MLTDTLYTDVLFYSEHHVTILQDARTDTYCDDGRIIPLSTTHH